MADKLFNLFDPSWAMMMGSLGTLYFTIKTYKERIEVNRGGVGIKNVDENGVAEIVNNSRVDISVRAEKFLLESGESSEEAKDFTMKFFNAKNKKDFVLDMIKNQKEEELMSEQILGSGETASFHIHDTAVGNINVVFVLLKLFFENKCRYYVYYFSNEEKNDRDKLFSENMKRKLNPHNKWVKIYSFE